MNSERLRAFIAGATAEVDGEFGFAVRLEGEEVAVGGDRRFPLASVFKIPVLIALLDRVADGRDDLAAAVTVTAADHAPGSGVLRELAPGVSVTVRDLATLMIIVSDNTATDMLCARVGLDAVNQALRRCGYDQTRIAMDCWALLARMVGADPAERGQAARGEVLRRLRARELDTGFDGGNDSTPSEMARMAEDLAAGRVLNASGTEVALDILQRQQLNHRLPLYLPPGVRCYHKTGTIAGTVNDVGVIALPGGRRLAVAALSRGVQDNAAAERAIGRVARAAYDEAVSPPAG